MIGRIEGTLAEKTPPQLLIVVNGIGYEVDVPMSTFYHLPVIGKPVSLNIHMIVRDDAHLLYGFGTLSERSLFKSLLKVNGVGARVALAILSGMNVEEFSVCINHKDVAALTRIPGIGKKTAERLVVEMGDKLPSNSVMADSSNLDRQPTEHVGERAQAVAALIALGYKPVEATRLIAKSGASEGAVEDIIRAALKQVAPA